MARPSIRLLVGAVILLPGLFVSIASGQQAGPQTSENSPALNRLLERRPEADLNQDGVLTLEEAKQARRQAQPARSRQNPRRAPKPKPTAANVPYGEHERHVLDFWRAESERPTPLFIWIHGGGFRGGDKSSFPADLLRQCLDAGISCAAIHYRLSSHAPYPAQMHDGARAVQFLRSKADIWHLDPDRFAAGGGSAGSGISQWLGYHPDLADAESDDPVSRWSTRLSCVIPINMQSTYDPREIKRLIPGDAYKHPALVPFFGRPPQWDWDRDPVDSELDQLLKDASPITHLTAGRRPDFRSLLCQVGGTGQHPSSQIWRAPEAGGRCAEFGMRQQA